MRKAKKKKEIEAQRAKPPTPTQTIDALIGDEERNGKQRKEEKEKQKLSNVQTLNQSLSLF